MEYINAVFIDLMDSIAHGGELRAIAPFIQAHRGCTDVGSIAYGPSDLAMPDVK
jgi:hypothetical protein